MPPKRVYRGWERTPEMPKLLGGRLRAEYARSKYESPSSDAAIEKVLKKLKNVNMTASADKNVGQKPRRSGTDDAE